MSKNKDVHFIQCNYQNTCTMKRSMILLIISHFDFAIDANINGQSI